LAKVRQFINHGRRSRSDALKGRIEMLKVNERIQIKLAEFNFTFARSGGPGGQNVNKVNSKVALRWALENSKTIPEDVRIRFKAKFHRRINKDGEFLIQSERFRDQGRNVADCLEKLRALLLEVATAPAIRRPTRRTKGSNERRLNDKKSTSRKKESRRRPTIDD
jgi:ribosome-associated protein